MNTWFRRVWHLLNRSRRERELVREMNEHRDSMHDASKFGDTHRLLEQSRDAWGWNWLDDAIQDLAVGVRTLAKAPAFAVTAMLILTFGIGPQPDAVSGDPGRDAASARGERHRLVGPSAPVGAEQHHDDGALSADAVREGPQQRAGRRHGPAWVQPRLGTRRRRADQCLVRVGQLVRRGRLRTLARARVERGARRESRCPGGRARLFVLEEPVRRRPEHRRHHRLR